MRRHHIKIRIAILAAVLTVASIYLLAPTQARRPDASLSVAGRVIRGGAVPTPKRDDGRTLHMEIQVHEGRDYLHEAIEYPDGTLENRVTADPFGPQSSTDPAYVMPMPCQSSLRDASIQYNGPAGTVAAVAHVPCNLANTPQNSCRAVDSRFSLYRRQPWGWELSSTTGWLLGQIPGCDQTWESTAGCRMILAGDYKAVFELKWHDNGVVLVSLPIMFLWPAV